jgi:hypothetical protein
MQWQHRRRHCAKAVADSPSLKPISRRVFDSSVIVDAVELRRASADTESVRQRRGFPANVRECNPQKFGILAFAGMMVRFGVLMRY